VLTVPAGLGSLKVSRPSHSKSADLHRLNVSRPSQVRGKVAIFDPADGRYDKLHLSLYSPIIAFWGKTILNIKLLNIKFHDESLNFMMGH